MKEQANDLCYLNNTNKPSTHTMFIHLMRLSLTEICQYQQQMHHEYKGNMPPEIANEISQNIKRHQEDFGKQGRIRKLILASESF